MAVMILQWLSIGHFIWSGGSVRMNVDPFHPNDFDQKSEVEDTQQEETFPTVSSLEQKLEDAQQENTVSLLEQKMSEVANASSLLSRFKDIFVFGDSLSDAGIMGYGNANMDTAEAGGYPTDAIKTPQANIKRYYGEHYPFSFLGYGYGTFTDGEGRTWPMQLGMNAHVFAHGSGTTCQEDARLGIQTPDGFKSVPSSTGMGSLGAAFKVIPRGVAQQFDEIRALPSKARALRSSLVVVYIGVNDYLYSDGAALPATTCDNYATIFHILRTEFRVPEQQIIFGGIPAIELMPAYRTLSSSQRRALVALIDATNSCIERIHPQRWTSAEHWRKVVPRGQKACVEAYSKEIPRLTQQARNFKAGAWHGRRLGKKCGYFLDEYHPTEKLHALMAAHFKSQFR